MRLLRTFLRVQTAVNSGQFLRGLHQKSGETDLLKHLRSRLKAAGPITVADYMREVLTNPAAGYYMHKDVFGTQGDFITSPEISQMFGELLGVWCVNEWMLGGSPRSMQVVELGPGRGTLAQDMLRVFQQFPMMQDAVSLHLVEVSPKMAAMQEERLTGVIKDDKRKNAASGEDIVYKRRKTKSGVPISWYSDIHDLPQGFSCYIAHEFLDALPVHKFQRTPQGWREVLVDVDDREGPHHLRFVLSPSPTAASKGFIQAGEKRDHLEVCPQAGVLVQHLADRIAGHGGAALLADYGHDGSKTDTLRGFRNHQLHEVLQEPGSADLTADVDFSYLRHMCMCKDKVVTHGPMTQREFLENMGIELRLQVLQRNADKSQRKDLLSGYDMLTNPDKMGDRFKFFSITRQRTPPKGSRTPSEPAGFYRLEFQ
ncbi:protein arginine methyltransferase NDUFAF7, mitochondrial-like [Branchiostoma lanceolatum]|uniref:protein arginine methyltransferase NDUFAF7, mitochondrial-like n=1 Tax=Branchiostoma lanceolatum TaxID=7740 RepID=UPI0034514E91